MEKSAQTAKSDLGTSPFPPVRTPHQTENPAPLFNLALCDPPDDRKYVRTQWPFLLCCGRRVRACDVFLRFICFYFFMKKMYCKIRPVPGRSTRTIGIPSYAREHRAEKGISERPGYLLIHHAENKVSVRK